MREAARTALFRRFPLSVVYIGVCASVCSHPFFMQPYASSVHHHVLDTVLRVSGKYAPSAQLRRRRSRWPVALSHWYALYL